MIILNSFLLPQLDGSLEIERNMLENDLRNDEIKLQAQPAGRDFNA